MNKYRVSKKVNKPSTKEKPNKDMSLLNEVEDEPRQQSMFGADIIAKPKEPTRSSTWNADNKKKAKKQPKPPESPGLFG